MREANPRRVVYTALIGEYEQLNEQPLAAGSDLEFICFTDDPELTSESWTIRVIEPRFPLDTVRSARYLKINGPELLSDYDESLWIDNSVRLNRLPEELLDDWLREADVAVPVHSFRTSVIGEFDAVATEGYDDAARVYEQLIHYSTLLPGALEAPPYWTALFARRHTPATASLSRLWYDHVLRYSRRDQLSINFVIAAAGITVNGVEIDNLGSEWHEWPVRVNKKWHVTQDRMAGALRTPIAELGKVQNDLMNARAERDEALRQRSEGEERERELASEIERMRELGDQSDRAQLDGLHDHYASSTSWRVTAPLRAVSRIFKRG